MCCGLHVVDDTYMLWMYVVDIIQHVVDHMLWVHVVGNTYLCCGEHVQQCCPQHVSHNMSLVLHIISYTLGCDYVVGNMLWTTRTYVVDDMFNNVVHNIYMFSTTYDMLWSTFTVFHYVPHNIHPHHKQLSTTYIHNMCSVTCCGCMLWRTTSTCCGAHMLWSATTFTDDV